MALDLKYGQVTVEKPGDMGADEPVVVFRSKDRLLPEVLRHYKELCAAAGSPPEHLARLDESLAAVTGWQEENRVQVPGTTPAS